MFVLLLLLPVSLGCRSIFLILPFSSSFSMASFIYFGSCNFLSRTLWPSGVVYVICFRVSVQLTLYPWASISLTNSSLVCVRSIALSLSAIALNFQAFLFIATWYFFFSI